MFHTIAEFQYIWQLESASTLKLLQVLTDASLAQQVAPGGRTLGRLAWHVAGTIPEMMNRTGLAVTGVDREGHRRRLRRRVSVAHE